MIDAAVAAKEVVGALALLAVEGTVIALVALALARRSRMRPAWQAAVWLVVLAKFALPWSPALPWSFADLLASLRGEAEAVTILWSAPAVPAAPVAATAPWAWLVVAALWAAGTVVVLAHGVLASLRTYRAAARAAGAPPEARALLAELGARRVRLAVGSPSVGPHVVGLVRPIIVVPPALVDSPEPALLRAALLHELAHVRRLDALGRAVQLLAVALFWWLPVVRLASRRLELARESACDAWALEAGDLSRPAYARLLVQMSRLQAQGLAPALAMAHPHALGARVASVLGAPVRARLSAAQRLALVAWIGLALGSARTAEAAADPTVVCVYTLELAESLRLAHPEADLDGDGVLSHDEACDLQAELARRVGESEPVSRLDDRTAELLAEPLCCNCDAALGPSSPATPIESCQAQE